MVRHLCVVKERLGLMLVLVFLVFCIHHLP
jgi:hypothetical protein